MSRGRAAQWEFLITADHEQGHGGARQLWAKLAGRAANISPRSGNGMPRLPGAVCSSKRPMPVSTMSMRWRKLESSICCGPTTRPYLPGYFLGGVPEYPQLFGCDTAYSVPGATAAGFAPADEVGLEFARERARMACGRVPHELTTNGRTFNPGNTQETPQFALAVWDYVRWSGDLPFLRQMYPLCREGVMDYVGGLWDADGDGYPWGDAMVERLVWAHSSSTRPATCIAPGACSARWRRYSDGRRPNSIVCALTIGVERFERDWWLPEQQLYANSLHSDLRPQLRWPLDTGRAGPAGHCPA